MYNQFKDELVSKLVGKISKEELDLIIYQLDNTSLKYNIEPAKYELEQYNPTELPVYLNLFIAYKKARGQAEGTINNYTYCLKNFFRTIKKPIEEITDVDITSYIYRYSIQFNLSKSSQDKMRQQIATFFAWCTNRGYIQKNPSQLVEKINYKYAVKVVVPYEDFKLLENECKSKRDIAILNILYCSGCRISEVINLKFKDLFLDKKRAFVIGKGSKPRYIPLSDIAIEKLNDYINNERPKVENPFIFLHYYTPHARLKADGFRCVLDTLSDKSGITKKYHISPHNFRHTFITNALKNGIPLKTIQIVVGHSSSATTDRYSHIDNTFAIDEYQEIMNKKDKK